MNLINYVQLHGDKDFNSLAFNEIDSAILSQISYIDFDFFHSNIQNSFENVPNHTILNEACRHTWRPQENALLMKEISKSNRFSSLSWHNYTKVVDDKYEQQFTAILFDLGNHRYYISYRGTESSFIGWKENMNMSYLKCIPSQLTALKYFTHCFTEYPGKYYLGGHSKGGTMACFAGINAPSQLQKNIIAIYNHDGPGMNYLSSNFNMSNFHQYPIYKMVPQSSVVGVMLEKNNYKIIRSHARSFFQHDLFTWEIKDTSFVEEPNISWMSRKVNRVSFRWIMYVDLQSRKLFVDTIYQVLCPKEIVHMRDIWKVKTKTTQLIINNIRQLDPKIKRKILSIATEMLILAIK
ncbi:hypothetical protein LES9216_02079 [Leuconostoc suionicum]|uniref:DUF2974 domain-containing protein n=1 Tax=Leuconostoc suionicum TaxID=1511761 RepID=A0A2N9KHW5_9LACO|nr:Mbeg1-like protein [Leuconostoc suionicum]SPD95079.1 hypothetical protein LES8486_02045 [Leuconostoc suionicum]SPE09881.1 hypothetical protein LES9216_02079 [Leuconostoc suionicum]SPH05682.1 hypothetical protein LES8484_02045 [Leuconostoc suionicum]